MDAKQEPGVTDAILAPRARRSPASRAPAAAALEAAGDANPALWPAVVPLLLAQSAGEPVEGLLLPGRSRFHSVTRSRLVDLAGGRRSPGDG